MTTKRQAKTKCSFGCKGYCWHGPRVADGVYWNSYWRETYTVLTVDAQSMTVQWHGDAQCINPQPPRQTTHCTAWDTRDRIISQP